MFALGICQSFKFILDSSGFFVFLKAKRSFCFEFSEKISFLCLFSISNHRKIYNIFVFFFLPYLTLFYLPLRNFSMSQVAAAVQRIIAPISEDLLAVDREVIDDLQSDIPLIKR